MPALFGLAVLAGVVSFGSLAIKAVAPARKKKGRVPPSINRRLPTPVGTFENVESALALKLEDLSWQGFELMIGELYRRQDYTVELCSGDGSDGGVDLRLRKGEQTVLVQCKHWKVYRVGVSPVRELFGILTAEKAHQAIFVTTGRFTRDARAFAAGKAIELIDGENLAAILEANKCSGAGDLLDLGSWTDNFAQAAKITVPDCPFCRSTMVLRHARQSRNPFWGCSTYPGCRGKRNVRPELMNR
jgi:restriction system protein